MTDVIKIDKNISLPAGAGRMGSTKYPWYEMEVGDSFFAPGRATTNIAAEANRRYAPKRFAGRHEEGGVRVWRIA